MLNYKEYIYAIYQEKSFSKAAKKLYVSQPWLSATVKKVEQQLQIPLFDRSTNPISLTEAGRYYIEQIERIMAIEEEKKLKLSRRVATSWVVISMAVAVFIGVVGNAMTAGGALTKLEDSETIIVQISSLLSNHGILPALLAGVILAGILAATMSTADSQLLAASSSVSQNLFVEFFGVKFSARQGILVARGTMIVVSLVAMFLARDPDSSVFRVVSFAWAGFGAAFGPTMLMALFWKRSNKYGATAGMIAGGVMVFLWKFGIAKLGGVFAIYELLPAFVVALIAIIVVSLCTAPPSKEITEEFDNVQADLHK